ncbi:MAG: hypothetical protein RLZZ11_1804, partial [Cyanobacteriota bacterium]
AKYTERLLGWRQQGDGNAERSGTISAAWLAEHGWS